MKALDFVVTKKVFFIQVVLLIGVAIFFNSCSNEMIVDKNDKDVTAKVSEIEVKQKFQVFNKKGKNAVKKMKTGFINKGVVALSEQEAFTMFDELYDDAYEALSYMGVNKDSLDIYSKEDIVMTSFILSALYEATPSSNEIENKVQLRSNSSLEAYQKTLNCLGRAVLGISILDGIVSAGETLGYQTALRLLGRSATRALGIVGAALVVYDFVDCMMGDEGIDIADEDWMPDGELELEGPE